MASIPADISLEPTVNLQNINAPHSSPNSGSESDEAARVYFGPLQSPEKKLIQVAHSMESHHRPGAEGSHMRRSGRFPSPLASRDVIAENADMSDTNESDEDTLQSRSGTPDNVRFPRDGAFVLRHFGVCMC